MIDGGHEERVAILDPQSGIAAEVIEQLLARKVSVAVLGRDLAGFDSTRIAATRQCDLTNFDNLSEALNEVTEELGGLTGLVNCAGSMLLKPAHLTSRADFDEIVASNLTTAFAMVRCAKSIFKGDGGSVVLLSSAAATLGMGNHEILSATKAAVENLARAAAATYYSSDIRFNVVAPGLIETALSHQLTQIPAPRNISNTLHPLGELGMPSDIARAICWLLDPDQSWITGQILGVDGGLYRVQTRPSMSIGGT